MIGLEADYGGVADRFAGAGRDFLGALLSIVSPGRLILQFLIAGVVVEAILAARVWFQLTSQGADAGLTGLVFRISEGLISPFVHLEPVTPIKTTGIIELSTLVAMEVYLVATLAAVVLVVFGRQFFRILRHVFSRRAAAAAESI
jgi:hypothetical protein